MLAGLSRRLLQRALVSEPTALSRKVIFLTMIVLDRALYTWYRSDYICEDDEGQFRFRTSSSWVWKETDASFDSRFVSFVGPASCLSTPAGNHGQSRPEA